MEIIFEGKPYLSLRGSPVCVWVKSPKRRKQRSAEQIVTNWQILIKEKKLG